MGAAYLGGITHSLHQAKQIHIPLESCLKEISTHKEVSHTLLRLFVLSYNVDYIKQEERRKILGFRERIQRVMWFNFATNVHSGKALEATS